jgi:hypothetical protein
VGPGASLDAVENKNNPLPLLEIEPLFFGHQECSLVAILTDVSLLSYRALVVYMLRSMCESTGGLDW